MESTLADLDAKYDILTARVKKAEEENEKLKKANGEHEMKEHVSALRKATEDMDDEKVAAIRKAAEDTKDEKRMAVFKAMDDEDEKAGRKAKGKKAYDNGNVPAEPKGGKSANKEDEEKKAMSAKIEALEADGKRPLIADILAARKAADASDGDIESEEIALSAKSYQDVKTQHASEAPMRKALLARKANVDESETEKETPGSFSASWKRDRNSGGDALMGSTLSGGKTVEEITEADD